MIGNDYCEKPTVWENPKGLEMGTASSDYIQLYEGNASLLAESLEVIPRGATCASRVCMRNARAIASAKGEIAEVQKMAAIQRKLAENAVVCGPTRSAVGRYCSARVSIMPARAVPSVSRRVLHSEAHL